MREIVRESFPHTERRDPTKDRDSLARLEELKTATRNLLKLLPSDHPLHHQFEVLLNSERKYPLQHNPKLIVPLVARHEQFLRDVTQQLSSDQAPVQATLQTVEPAVEPATVPLPLVTPVPIEAAPVAQPSHLEEPAEVATVPVARRPAVVSALEPVPADRSQITTTSAQTPESIRQLLNERERIYTVYERVLQKKAQLEQALEQTSHWSWLKRNSIQVDINEIEKGMTYFQKKYPWLMHYVPKKNEPLRGSQTQPDLATAIGRAAERQVLSQSIQETRFTSTPRRQTLLNKYVATGRADTVQELEQQMLQSLDLATQYQYWLHKLREHRQHKPRFLGMSQWQKRQAEIESNLATYRQLKRGQATATNSAQAV